jgi:Na+-driven multidrug efflux pump
MRGRLNAGTRYRQPAACRAVSSDGSDQSLKTILTFSLPSCSLVLSEPLLNLATSFCVGHACSSAELAAIGPANVCLLFIQYVFISIQIALLGCLGKSIHEGKVETEGQRLFSSALGSATGLGALVTLTLVAFPSQLIQLTGVKDVAVQQYAASFLRLRSLGSLPVLVVYITQAAFLSQKDPLTPSRAALLGITVSLLGHYWTVFVLHWGLNGAALSTSVANVIASVVLLMALRDSKGPLKPIFMIPRVEDLSLLGRTIAPLASSYLTKNGCYVLLSTAAASTLSTLHLAAHQALFAFWGFFTFLTAPIEQSLMALIPSEGSNNKANLSRIGLITCTVVSMVSGLVVFALALKAPHVFTSDSSLWPLLATCATQAAISMALAGFDVASTAINISRGDAAFVAQSYLVTFTLIFAFTSAVRCFSWGLISVWDGILLFFSVRSVQSALRVHRYV